MAEMTESAAMEAPAAPRELSRHTGSGGYVYAKLDDGSFKIIKSAKSAGGQIIKPNSDFYDLIADDIRKEAAKPKGAAAPMAPAAAPVAAPAAAPVAPLAPAMASTSSAAPAAPKATAAPAMPKMSDADTVERYTGFFGGSQRLDSLQDSVTKALTNNQVPYNEALRQSTAIRKMFERTEDPTIIDAMLTLARSTKK
jgi:hypothetical protein